jgi:transcriptional regulator with XRE-family HTH domain
MNSTLSLRVKTIRERLNLKQSYVAEKMAMKQQSYSQIENSAETASHETLYKIAEAMNIDYAFLINLEIPINDSTLAHFQNNKVCDSVNRDLKGRI